MNKSACGLAVLLLGCLVAGLSAFKLRFLGKKVGRAWIIIRVAGLPLLLGCPGCWAALVAALPLLLFPRLTRACGSKQARLLLQLSCGIAPDAPPRVPIGAAFQLAPASLPAQVVLLGLYNGQRLEGEPEQDIITYSRVDEVRK